MPKPVKRKTVEEFDGRPVVYPEIRVLKCVGPDALTAERAKELLGWTEEGKEPFGDDFLLVCNGKKIRCLHNDRNRPFSTANARIIAQEILRRKFVLNGETLIIGKTGRNLSCQHRLVGLVLADAEYRANPDNFAEFWDVPPTVETLIVLGIDESDTVVNTIDTGRPRSLADVIFRSEYFANVRTADRSKVAKMAEYAVRLLWERTGADSDAHGVHRTHAEALDFISRHPKILEAVRFIYEEDGNGEIRKVVGLGYAAGLLYLMGSGGTNPRKYRLSSAPNETDLSWDRWDDACKFWVLVSTKSPELAGLRESLARILNDVEREESNGGSLAERLAMVGKAWSLFSQERPVTGLRLRYHVESGEAPRLLEFPTVGGIDRGPQAGTDEPDPTPEEVEKLKQEVVETARAEKKAGRTTPKKPQ